LDFSGFLAGGAANGRIVLGWNYMKDPDLEGFEIYRAVDNNEKRSYKFVTVQEAESNPSQTLGTYMGYVDFDTDFVNVPVQTSYYANITNQGTVVTGGTVTNSGTNYTVTPQNPNMASNPQMGVTLHYWVMARYMDGATSPLSNEFIVQIP
jgi:hypothetical protein